MPRRWTLARIAPLAALVLLPALARAQSSDSTEKAPKSTYFFVSLSCFNLDPNKMASYTSGIIQVERPEDFSDWDEVEKDIGAQAKDELRANGAECLKLAAVVFRYDTRGEAVVGRRKQLAQRPSNVRGETFEFEYVDKGQ